MRFRWLRLVVSTSLILSLAPLQAARASLSDCQTEISPHLIDAGSDTYFSFGLHNTNSDPIQWLRVTSPGTNYLTLESGASSGWNATVGSDTVVFDGSSLSSGLSQGYFVQGLAPNHDEPTGNWTIEVSDAPDGSGAITCSGDMTLTISSNPSVINITNIGVTSLSWNQATIQWDTDVASTSQVRYGLDTNYGSTSPLDSSLNTTHVVTLTGLQSNVGYHFQVVSTTPNDGGSAVSGDNTFLTSIAPPPAPTPIIVNNIINNITTTGTVPGVEIKATPTEHIPPVATVSGDFSKPFKQAPTITGLATDNEAVARVEYSIDGGRDWLPVDRIQLNVVGKGRNAKATAANVTFTFTPNIIEDGDYQVMARAIDSSSNVGTSGAVKMVIDRLPPQLGPLVVSYGPEALAPDQTGSLKLIAGSDYKLTTSGVGGPISVTIEADRPGQADPAATFMLSQSADSGLWNGVLSFKTGGSYQLVIKSLDGAGNRTTRQIATAIVTPAGQVIDTGTTHAVAGARLTLYYLEPSTSTWQVWDGAPYGQDNPQTTTSDGRYSLMIPEGKYYLKVQAPLHHTFISNIFTAAAPTGITSIIPLGPMLHVGAGSLQVHLPDLTWHSQPLPAAKVELAKAVTAPLAGTDLPDFTLPTTSGGTKRALDLTGRPTVISLLTTWSPGSQSQLPALTAVQANPDVNVAPVFSQERVQLVSTYLATAGSSLTALIDADGVLVPSLQVGSLPEHIFVDRTGRIKKVMVGVLSKDELLGQLGGL